jgi:hypothetical protein
VAAARARQTQARLVFGGASPKRAWIGVKRQSVPATPAVSAKRRTAWNPWLWTK